MERITFITVVAVVVTGAHAQNSTDYQNEATQKFLEHLNEHLTHYYLYALLGLIALVFVYHSALRMNRHVRHLTSLGDNMGAHKYFAKSPPFICWLKDHLLYAPLLHHRRATEIKFSKHFNLGTIPTRAQAIFIGFIIVYNVFACVYHVPWSNKDQLEVLPILRARTGTISVVNLIPIILMSTIKNPLINMLDISYDSFNLIHRWLGRLSILQGIAHTLCYVIGKAEKSGWPSVGEAFKAPFIWTGMMATAGFTIILFHSPKLIRSWAYEFFLHSHMVLVAITFAGLWYHLEELPQRSMLLAAILLWAASRIWRLMTIVYRSCGRGGCKAIIEVMPGEAMRIEFTTPRPWKFKSGQTLYLCIPSIGLFSSHPFSVAWSEFVLPESMKECELSRSASTRTVLDEKPPVINRTEEVQPEVEGKQTFSLIVKKREGFTAKMYEKALKKGDQLMVNAFVEGPYGHAKSMSSYGSVLLFASGVGITHQMPYVRDLVQGYADGTIATKRVTLVWIVPDTDHLEWVRPWMHDILGMEKRREVLKVLLFISKATLRHEIKSPSETVRMARGRPHVQEIVRRECQEGIGCLGISVCAGGGLSDEVRRATRLMVGQGYNADLCEEFFGW